MNPKRATTLSGWVSRGMAIMAPMMATLSWGQEAAKNPEGSPHTASAVTLADAHDWRLTGLYERAMKAYQTLELNPKTALEAALGLARCRLRIGEYQLALTDLEKLAAGQSARWHALLARTYRLTGDYKKTLTHVRRAVEIDPNLAGARLLLGQMLELLGKRDDAIQTYRWFDRQLVEHADLPHDAPWVTDTALGFLRYSALTQTRLVSRTKHVHSQMLQPAYTRIDRLYWPARIASADLLREKFNNDPQDGSVADYNAALRINQRLPEAFVGLGAVALESWDFDKVESLAGKALAINPHFPPAIHLLARSQILQRRYGDAIDTCERALAVNPNDLVALSLSAAANACRYDSVGVDRMRSRAASIHPHSAVLHRTLGIALSGIRQYEASERELQEAIQYDSTDPNARTELGMMYMQWGQEAKARDALEASWSLDPFNQRTKFTLELLESIEKLARYETDHFMVRYDPQLDPGLGPMIGTYLETIHEPVTDDFHVTLNHKTMIEVFPTHREFAVRITGQPWIHTIGACTGRVIAIESPRKAPGLMGPYHFGRVLKHEFTHTVTLAATKNRIPHWFTEGLAVAEEDAPRPFDWYELLADAVRRGSLFTLKSINWAFIRPQHPTDRTAAYAQSEWMCEYLIERFGYDSLSAMLDRYRNGQTQREVFQQQFRLDEEDFDRDFQAWAKKQVARWGFDLTPPEKVETLRNLTQQDGNNASLLGRLARALYDAGDFEPALQVARQALELDKGDRNALKTLVRVLALYREKAPTDAARQAYDKESIPALERLLQRDSEGWIAPKLLAAVSLRKGQKDRGVELLQRLQRLCPMDPTSWRGLAGIYLERGQADKALHQLEQLARTENNDADVPARIAKIYQRKGKNGEARYWWGQSLFINPFSETVHQALGDLAMRTADTAGALREYSLLTVLDPDQAEYFQQAAIAAHKLGDEKKAREFARKAVELDPASPARSLLSKP